MFSANIADPFSVTAMFAPYEIFFLMAPVISFLVRVTVHLICLLMVYCEPIIVCHIKKDHRSISLSLTDYLRKKRINFSS